MAKIEWSKIDPHELEFLIGECFSKLGYSIVQTKLTVDGGVDVIADKFDEVTRTWLRFVIQVKRHKAPIGVSKVRELNGILNDFKAVKGILIGVAGFTKAAKDFERAHLEQVSLWDARALLKLLEAANLIDSEGNFRKTTDPNLKSNRWNFICMMLRESRPNLMNSAEITEALRRRHRVTVPVNIIESDLIELAERGDIIELEDGLYHARMLEAEVEEICAAVAKEIQKWDFHFDKGDVAEYVAKSYKISLTYVLRFMRDNLIEIINKLKRDGLLFQIDVRYFTERGLENFRNIRLSKKEMKENLIEFFGISNKDWEKPITSIIAVNKPITFLDKKNPRKKIIAFKQILPFKCPHCGRFSLEIMELIPLIVVPSSLKVEQIEVGTEHTKFMSLNPGDVIEILKCSSLYVKRLRELVDNYNIGQDDVSAIAFKANSALFVIDLKLKEKNTVREMINNIIRESYRFQNFLTDLNQSLPGFGFPRQVARGLITKVSPAEEKTEGHTFETSLTF